MKVVVGDSKFAFIKVTCIIDYTFFAHKLFKGYNRKGFFQRYVLMVDIRKAYNSLDWSFLKRLLIEQGFS